MWKYNRTDELTTIIADVKSLVNDKAETAEMLVDAVDKLQLLTGKTDDIATRVIDSLPCEEFFDSETVCENIIELMN